MSHTPLHVIEVRGDSRQRGVQHGEQLREPIARAVAFYEGFYRRYLEIGLDEMRRRASAYIDATAEMSPQLAQEFEGIAEGSGRSLETIYALAARYEITFEKVQLGECSNVFVGAGRTNAGRALLGMNWEWRPEVLDFRAIITGRCDDGPDYLVVTECGTPGKFGLNEHGVVAIESGLNCTRPHSTGRQVFANVIRHALAQETLAAARAVLRDHPPEATVSYFLADADGQGVNVECAPAGLDERQLQPDEIYWHTNHCRLSDEPTTFEDSVLRGERWQQLLAPGDPIAWQTVGGWLADTENGANAICKAPQQELANLATYLQTLASIVLDPGERTMWVSDGMSSRQPYRRFGLRD